ncbi:Hypothetical predicted protein [Pelobates cultripes]|uniref:Uncharacterized protein n=1 Tax=Pelobates cultripes TaxID=61616 RepID=A0AAD1W680_PELCU|nr:Hypothetical predicted protein [Pelobates cultripes]
MSPQDFSQYEDNGLIRYMNFFHNQKVIPFLELPRKVPLNTFDQFRYLQLRSFLNEVQNIETANKKLTHFDRPVEPPHTLPLSIPDPHLIPPPIPPHSGPTPKTPHTHDAHTQTDPTMAGTPLNTHRRTPTDKNDPTY